MEFIYIIKGEENKMKEKIKVYRLHLKPEFNEQKFTQEDLIQLCKHKGIIGIGYSGFNVKEEYKNEEDLNNAWLNSPYKDRKISNIRRLSQINAGDII